MAAQKYFIALVPPQPILSEIEEIKQRMASVYGSKGALRSPAHITLHMPFEYDAAKEEKLFACLSGFKFEPVISIELNNYACFEPRVIFINVVKNELLLNLQGQLVQHVKSNLHLYNQANSLRGFHPHITVAFRDLRKPLFYKAWEDYQHKPFHAEFSCQSIALLKSTGNLWEAYREFNLQDDNG